MGEALKGTPSARMPRPEGLIDVRVSRITGLPVTNPSDPDAINETFIADHQPGQPGTDEVATPGTTPANGAKPAATGSGVVVF